jgi:NifU-like protein involved in Fe-S cluster formation/bacterioferritin-associated ferredoxin
MSDAPLSQSDVISPDLKKRWFYTDAVKDHFFNPRNFMDNDVDYKADGMGMVGSPACGDMMTVWIKVDPTSERVTEMKWKTFGCGSAIASTSMHSVMVTENGGRTLEEAGKIKPQDIMARLGGLPNRKIHCSVLSDKALRGAVNDYFRRSGQTDRIKVEGARVIDKVLKITDHDIEEAVLDGADTLEKVQQKTKVGTGDPSCVPEVEQLIRFYKEKYFGAES